MYPLQHLSQQERDELEALDRVDATAEIEARSRPSSFRPSRMLYPGSKFGPKTRYDLPQRHMSCADDRGAMPFGGPNTWPMPNRGYAGAFPERTTGAVPKLSCGGTSRSTPRTPCVLSDAARAMFHPLAERNLPELPLIDTNNDVHGIVVLGGRGAGKTALVHSIIAGLTKLYSTRFDLELFSKKCEMPTNGQCYELPEQEITLGDWTTKTMRVILTDTPPCGTNLRDEQPLCATVSPNSTRYYNAIPCWMRIALRGGNFPHYAVLFVVDSMAKPLWEDSARCREIARLMAVLRKQYTIAIAVTKLAGLREMALRDANHGADHGGVVGRDPRSSYEAFSGRYVEKVCASIQGKADENDWSFSQGPNVPAFPEHNQTIFDVPTWTNVGEFKKFQERKGTHELPNFRYAISQQCRLLKALLVRLPSET